MNYQPYVYFWSASSLSAAMKKAQKIIDTCCTTECMMQILEDNFRYAPSIRTHATVENWQMAMQADSTWLYKLFNFRFAYWKEHKLLGMAGNLSKDELKTTGAVYLKDSCDMDCDLKTWKRKIPFSKERIKKFSSLSDPDENAMARYTKSRKPASKASKIAVFEAGFFVLFLTLFWVSYLRGFF